MPPKFVLPVISPLYRLKVPFSTSTLFGGGAGIGQVLEMIPDLIFLTLALILIPVAFFAADQIRNGAELVVDRF